MKTGLNRIVWLVCLFAAARAQEALVTIDSEVDRSRIRIGDLVNYSVTLTRSPEVTVEMPPPAANLGAFEIRDYHVFAPEKMDGKVVERVTYTISTFDTGKFEIPPLTFRYTVPDDTTRYELQTRKLQIVVESLKPSEAGDIRDIKQPWEIPFDWRKWVVWSSVGFAGLLVLALLFYIWRRKRAGKGLLPEKVEPPRPAHEVAIEELDALQASSLLAEGKVKEFYIRLADIIRRYVEGRYYIFALELTTTELLQRLEEAEVEAEHRTLFRRFLEQCDLVKFAKYQPGEAEHAETLRLAYEIVEQTRLVYDTLPVSSEPEGTSQEEAQLAQEVEVEEGKS